MKQYKKGLLAICVLTTMTALVAATAQDDRIFVTTFADEDGENSSACSLREAITAAAQNKPYGGCPAGKTHSSLTDAIVLEKGEYLLTKSLQPASQVYISGAEQADWSKKDAIIGEYPARLAPVTTIKGTGQFPLIDTSLGKATVTLTGLNLVNGGGKKGAAIFAAGGAISLDYVHVKDNTATEEGGAIHLAGIGSSLEAKNSLFQNNNAPKGAVLSMTCMDNLNLTERLLKIATSSIVNNGSANSKNIIELCGQPSFDLQNSTVALNTANTTDGTIIKFTGDSRPNTQDATILSANSDLIFSNNTIIQNKAFATFLYDSIANKSLSYNIIAYNEGYSCRHLLGPLDQKDKNKIYRINGAYNGVIKSATKDGYCDLLYEEKDSNVDLSTINRTAVLTELQKASQYTAHLPMYFLRIGNNPLVNVENASGCIQQDQRGKERLTEVKDNDDKTNVNTCDLGAVEQANLKASNIAGTNTSQIDIMANLIAEKNFFKGLVDDPTVNKDFLPYYKIRDKEFADKLENYPKTMRYRQVYLDIFSKSFPHEILNSEGALEIQHFADTKLYKVEAKSIGTGPNVLVTGNIDELPKEQDPNLKCEWDDKIERLLMYRTDGKVNQAGDYGYCKYTLILKSNPKIKSEGIAQAQFVNIAPVASSDLFVLDWGSEQRIKIDVLANDNDNGDGKKDVAFYPKDKKIFYTNAEGISAPIKFSKIDSNLKFEAQYEAPCPDESGDTCYGGDIYVQPKNSFNKFNFLLEYQFYDADATISNTAYAILQSTATTTNDTRDGKSAGGGSFGIFTLLGLIGLGYWRRKH